MTFRYIYHSSFYAVSSTAAFLFDYYRGGLPEFPPDRPLYVFASHFHQDHFNPDIFRIAETHPDVTYILTKDIKKHRRIPADRNIVILKPGEGWEDGIITVETLRSNDEGAAFIVTFRDSSGDLPESGDDSRDAACDAEKWTKTIYHAGDLNNWYWDKEEDSLALVKAYHEELAAIRGRFFDAACIPLDPRLGAHAFDGITDFMGCADAGTIYPMHMWDDYGIIDRLKTSPEAAAFRDRIAPRAFYEG